MKNRSPKAHLIYLSLLVVGFGWMLWTSLDRNLKSQEVAWLFWATSFLLGPVILLLGQFERFRRSGKINSFRKNVAITVLVLFGGAIAIYFVHILTGAFLSVVAEIEPIYYFGRNGFINHFAPEAGWILFERYWFLIPAYLTVKSSALTVSSRARQLGHGTLRDPLLSLFAVGLSLFFSSNIVWSLVAFGLVFFAPWTLIASKDITAKRRDHEPDLDPQALLPVQFLDRGSLFWGIIITAFGSVFLALGIWFPYYMLSLNSGQIGTIVASLIFFFAFGGFATLAMLFGFTMIFRYRLVRIDEGNVRCEERHFPRQLQTITWQESISSYSLQKEQIHHRDSDGISYEEYLILLKHFRNSGRDVTLYRAFHEEGWTEKFQDWQNLLISVKD